MFTPFEPLGLRNRSMRSSTWEGMADKETGAITPRLLNVYTTLAENEVGLVMVSHSYIDESGKAGKGQISIATDDVVCFGLSNLLSSTRFTSPLFHLSLAILFTPFFIFLFLLHHVSYLLIFSEDSGSQRTC